MLFVLNWQLTLLIVAVVLCGDVLVCPLQRQAQQGLLHQCSSRSLGEPGRLHRGDDGRAEGGQGLQPRGGKPAEPSTRKTRPCARPATGAQTYAATMMPAVVTISYINYAIVAVLGGIMALQGLTDVGSLASYLVFVRQAAVPHQPVHPAEQLPAGGAGRCGAGVPGHGPGAGGGRGQHPAWCEVDENGRRDCRHTQTDRWAWREDGRRA